MSDRITSLHPALEVMVKERDGQTVVDVLRLAEDGWMGWHEQGVGETYRHAEAIAFELVKRRIAAEAQLAAEIEANPAG